MNTIEIVSLKAAYDYASKAKPGKYVNLREVQELTLQGKAGSERTLNAWKYANAC